MSHLLPTDRVRGSRPGDPERAGGLEHWLNPLCLDRLRLLGGERVLEVGSGSGSFARDMARATGGRQVVCVEPDEGLIYRCLAAAEAAGESRLLDLRQGSASDLPLRHEEWGSFDLVHCRFVLGRCPRPQAVVQALARALRPGGRMVLVDDDHDVLRLWPPLPALVELWRGLIHASSGRGHDPAVGRKLLAMLRVADLRPLHTDSLFLGGCAGENHWELVVDHLEGRLTGARKEILAGSAIPADLFDEVIDDLRGWRRRPDSALWYHLCWAEAEKPA